MPDYIRRNYQERNADWQSAQYKESNGGKNATERDKIINNAAFNAAQKKKETPTGSRHNTKNLTAAKMPPN